MSKLKDGGWDLMSMEREIKTKTLENRKRQIYQWAKVSPKTEKGFNKTG